ncbi:hypothetical protein [Niveispirillum sp. KHB5.9]|uniref:hypothetical protein n=1 Tax=Niveispirillum sp. KHB5.9 TaxID=3400269 RepID=UPI003A83E0B4
MHIRIEFNDRRFSGLSDGEAVATLIDMINDRCLDFVTDAISDLVINVSPDITPANRTA